MVLSLILMIFLFSSVRTRPFLGNDCDVIDLTHPFEQGKTIYWPTANSFKLDVKHKGINKEKGYYYSSNDFSASEHGGTHLDAPIHFYKGKQTADQIPLKNLFGPACVVDISKKTEKDKDYRLTVTDLQEWESIYGKIGADCLLIIKTGWEKYYMDKRKYLGHETDPNKLHFPGIHPEAAKWIAEERPVRAVGLDTASLDYGQSQYFKTHQNLFEKNIPGFENLMNLDKLPPIGASIVALPMKIKGGSGGPLRAIAFINCKSAATSNFLKFSYLPLAFSIFFTMINGWN